MIKSLLSLLNSREKFQLIYVFLGLVISSLIEVLNIGIFLPLISILIEGDHSFFGLTIENYINSYHKSTIVVFVCTSIIGIFFFKNIYLYLYNYCLSRYLKNIQQRISYDLFKTYLHEQNSILNEKKIIDTIYSLKNLKNFIIISHKHELLSKCDKIYQIDSNGIHQKS